MSNPLIIASRKSTTSGNSTFPYTASLVHGTSSGPTNNSTFLESANNYSFSVSGTPAQGSFTPYGSCWSHYFNNATLVFANSSNFGFGTSAFTVECWINFGTIGSNTNIFANEPSGGGSGVSCYINSAGYLAFYDNNGNGKGYISTAKISIGTWYHIALTRDNSNNCYLFLNGSLVSTNSVTSDWGSLMTFTVGSTNAGNYYVSNLRVEKGVARYTSNFTPSTTPLTSVSNTVLLVCNANNFLDSSGLNSAPTISGSPKVVKFNPFGNNGVPYSTTTYGGSCYYNGSSYLIGPSGNSITQFSGQFTVEFWYYPTSLSNSNTIIYNWGSQVAVTSSFNLSVNTNGTIGISYGIGGTNANLSSTIAVTPFAWNHIAVTRDSSNNIYFGVNGTIQKSSALAGTFNSSNAAIGIGASGSSGGPITSGASFYANGYVGDISIINGTCKYSANYTPPSSPLTKVTGSTLLLSFQNAGIVDSSMNNNLMVIGSPTITSTKAKFGSNSIDMVNGGYYSYYGSSSHMSIAASEPFTMEAWTYYTSTSETYYIYTNQINSTGNLVWFFAVVAQGANSAGAYGIVLGESTYGSNQSGVYSGVMPTINQWNHIACTRDSSGTVRLFLNGVLQTTNSFSQATTFNPNMAFANSTSLPVALGNKTTTGEYYLQDFRLLNGYCAYTSTFTPPSAPFANS